MRVADHEWFRKSGSRTWPTGLMVMALLLLVANVVPGRTACGREETPYRLPRLIEETFDNGLHVIVCPTPGAGLVDVRVEVAVGTWLEGDRDGVGLSHFFEHLMLGGTTSTRSGADSVAMLRAKGAMWNARTDTDRTWFEIQAPPDGLAVATELLADWVRRATVEQEALDKERGVILEELSKAADEDMRQAWDNMLRTAYTRHPARLPVIGDASRMESITRQELLAFKEAHFIPRTSVVAITGDIDPADALALVRTHFGDWEGPYVDEPEVGHEPKQMAPRQAVRQGTGTLASVVIGYRTVGQRHPDTPVLDVIQHALSSGRGGRVYTRAVEDEGWTGGTNVLSWNPSLGGGVLAVMAATKPDLVAPMVEGISREVERLSTDRLSDEELARAKAQLRASTVFGLERTTTLGHRLATDYLTTGSCRYVEGYVERVASVTVEDVLRVARAYLRPAGRTVSEVRPVQYEVDGGSTNDASNDATNDATNDASNDATDEASPSAAPVGPGSEVEAVQGVRWEKRLASGGTLRVEDRPGGGTVAVHAAFPAGVWTEAAGEVGATAVLSAMMRPNEESSRIAARLEAAGGQLGIGHDESTIYFQARVLAADLGGAVSWIVTRAGSLGLERSAFDSQLARTRDRLAARRGSFRREAPDRLRAALFDGAGAFTVVGDEAALSRLDWAGFSTFAQATFRADHLSLAVVGDARPEDVRRVVEPLVATLPRGERRTMHTLGTPSLGGDPVWVPSKRRQAVIALGFAGARADAGQDRVALDIIDTYVCGRRVSGGVLYDALRVDSDLAYYIDSSNRPMPGGGFFQLVIQCDPPRVGEVLKATEAVLADVAAGEIDEVALGGARHELLISRAMADQTTTSRARMLALGGAWGLPLDAIERYRAQVLSIDADEIRAVAARVLGGDRRRVMLWPEGVPKP